MKILNIEIKYSGQVIGTTDIEVDESLLCPPCDCSDKVLSFDNQNDDYLQLSSPILLSGEFSMDITTQNAKETNNYITLFGDSSTGNRVMVKPSSGLVILNIGGYFFQKGGISMDYIKTTNTKIYRDANNDIFIQLDGGTPTLIANASHTFTLSKICKSASGGNSNYFNGILHNFTIGQEYFECSEGSGNTITGTNQTEATITTSSTTPNYIDDYIWSTPIPEGLAIQVHNEGVPSNSSLNLLNRLSDVTQHNPDICIIMVGANDALNLGNIQLPNQFESNLNSIVSGLPNMDIIFAYTPPCVDSYLKAQGDYTPIYGDESLYNLNEKLQDLRSKMDVVASNYPNVSVVDTLSPFTVNGDPQITVNSFIRNALNAGGQEDGVHPNNGGQEAIADALVTAATGYSNIVCFGDSITYGVGATSWPVYLAQKLNA